MNEYDDSQQQHHQLRKEEEEEWDDEHYGSSSISSGSGLEMLPLPYFESFEDCCPCCASSQSEESHCQSCILIHWEKWLTDALEWQEQIEEDRMKWVWIWF
jgi:hypothetical protein